MLDAHVRPLIDPPLAAAGCWLARRGWSADSLTILGFGLGLAAAATIAGGATIVGLVLLLAGRLCDGLDGAVAGATRRTDRGAFLDITLDFAFYAAVPLAFAVLDPAHNGLPAALLLASFLANGSAFLAFAIMAERRGLTTAAQGNKSLYYVMGLAEGTETIAVFALCCLLPALFPWLATGFAVLCLLSAAARIAYAWRALA